MGGVFLGIFRFFLGMVIGVEYLIGVLMFLEFVLVWECGLKLVFFELCWCIGFFIVVLLGYVLLWFGVLWKVILVILVILVFIVFGL